ncbi:hypothetical protein RB628_42105, partial [Streptomyces sp. ADMS]|uniref:hypothetical protein n=1 Tax=Streptomyces sp. ADMS TaxID=3071415 RepID=UPI00296E9CA3
VLAASDALASQGLRVLAVARRELDGPHPAQDEAESGLSFLGLVGMLDPPRPEVTDAVAACRPRPASGSSWSPATTRSPGRPWP